MQPRSVNLLTPEEARELAKSGDFSKSQVNPTLKDNREAKLPAAWHGKIFEAIVSHVPFAKHVYPPRLNKYSGKERYKAHTDAPFMECDGGKIRTDLSLTLWLNDGYEGGELVIDGVPHKGEPGQAIIYSGSTIHEVRPVTRGERICLITWIQSEFRDPEIREIMGLLCEVMHERHNPKIDNVVARMTKRYAE